MWVGAFDGLGCYVMVCRGRRHKTRQNGPTGELLGVLPHPDDASHSPCPHSRHVEVRSLCTCRSTIDYSDCFSWRFIIACPKCTQNDVAPAARVVTSRLLPQPTIHQLACLLETASFCSLASHPLAHKVQDRLHRLQNCAYCSAIHIPPLCTTT